MSTLNINNDYIHLNSTSSDKVVVEGNLGIGTTSPAKKLHISGSDSDGVRVSGGTNNRYVEVTSTSIDFYTTSVSGYGMANLVRKNSDGSVLGHISGAFGTSNTLTYTYYGGTAYNNAAMYILSSNKNVGIGTTSPAYKLSVNGDIQIPQNEYIYFDNTAHYIRRGASNVEIQGYNGLDLRTNGSTRLFINQSGNVGIGTTSPIGKLNVSTGTAGVGVDVVNQANGTISFANGSGGTAVPNIVGKSTNNVGLNIRAATPDVPAAGVDMQFFVNETDDTDYATLTSTAYRFMRHTTPLFNILRNGNFGIGTTSPASDLHVNSSNNVGFTLQHASRPTISLTDGTNYGYIGLESGGAIITGTSDNDISIRSPRDIVFGGGPNARMTIKNAGNVGIGTTSPDRQLQVHESTSGTSTAKFTNSTTGEDGDTGFFIGINGSEQPILFGYNSTDMIIGTNGTERMRIESSGNVGIGITNPGAKLHVNGDVIRVVNSTWSGIEAHNTNGAWESFVGTESGGGGNRYNSASSKHTFYNNSNAVMTINSSGNLGIGTTSPSAKLSIISGGKGIHVDKGGYSSTSANLSECRTNYAFAYDTLRNGSTTGFFITNVDTNVPAMQAVDSSNNAQNISIQPYGGNVGIGTASPDVEMHISSGASRIRLTNDSNQTWQIGTNNVANGFLSIKDITDSKDVLVLTGDGNVGIGTTSPSKKLHVKGKIAVESDTATVPTITITDINNAFQAGLNSTGNLALRASTGMYLYTGGTVNRIAITNTGNVGIGTATPTTKLYVDGGESTLNRGNTDGAIARFRGNNAEQAVIGTVTSWFDSNVGIGTTSPNASLHIEKAGDQASSVKGITLSSGASGTNKYLPAIVWSYGASGTPDFAKIESQRTSGTGARILFSTASTSGVMTEAMRIQDNGNVGIGTTSPSYKLDVSGTARVVKSKIDITPTSDTIALDVRGTGTPNDYFTISNATGGANDVFLPIFFYKAATYGYNGGTNRYTSGVYGGGFVAAVDDTSYPNAAGAGAAMHFNARTYANNGPLTNRYLFSWGSWLTTHMAMTAGGNLLIGKTSDNGEKLQVNGNADVSGDVNADGDFYQNGTQGWSGTINIPTNPPITITVQGGIITNVT